MTNEVDPCYPFGGTQEMFRLQLYNSRLIEVTIME
jgi:hypothetical protein